MGKKPEDLRGIRNNNPGNIEYKKSVKWQGQKKEQTDGRFIQFETPEDGIRAIAKTLITYYEKRQATDGSKIDTIQEIVDRWAPPHENNTSAYANHVAKILNIGVDETLNIYDFNTMKGLVIGIIAHENAGYKYKDEVLNKGIALAGLVPPKKSLTKSKTIAASALTAVSTAGGQLASSPEVVNTMKENLAPFMDFEFVKYICLGLTFIGIGITVYAYLNDRKKRIT